ncbi:carcinoembryonic antigen-related cell adhesion molecule 1-like isoform X2 [Megalobrama amblycephala]|uniref:carcinoembryonic antigen-related cell adhesion molecule 1-like isoform X2 n=1 Tax=Megalobrama amblycephala TaxID=75352 RepID=UPI0020142EF9|nr:carcinoembryonic antigen-related cell adhesion molecule 1-like isoform X2 [Megalobrama amblycephala]
MLKNKVIVCVFVVFAFIVHGKSDGTDEVSVSVMEGDSVTLYTNITRNKQDRIKWYFNNSRITHIDENHTNICTDIRCIDIFRDKLKVDSSTGDLTITNIRNTDSGVYQLKFGRSSGNIFSVSVSGVSAAEGDQVTFSVKKGESVTLGTSVGKNPFDVMKWYFNDILMAEITGDQSKICTDVQCDEKFRDRLKLDHQTGSLTIMDTRNTDSGEYKVEITISSRFSIIRSFNVTVTDPGLSPGAKAGIIVGAVFGALLLGAAVGGGIYHYYNIDDKENMHGVPYEVLKNDG